MLWKALLLRPKSAISASPETQSLRTAKDAPYQKTKIGLGNHPAAEHALDVAQFADTMSTIASTVCVVTASDGQIRLGRTVTAMLSLSAHPPSLVVSITNTSDLAALITRTCGFSLGVLAHDQQALGDGFAGKIHPDHRFDAGQWSAWTSGQPRLDDGVASIDCRLAGVIEMDTHTLFAGIIVNARTDAEKQPLLWHGRGYAQVSRS